MRSLGKHNLQHYKVKHCTRVQEVGRVCWYACTRVCIYAHVYASMYTCMHPCIPVDIRYDNGHICTQTVEGPVCSTVTTMGFLHCTAHIFGLDFPIVVLPKISHHFAIAVYLTLPNVCTN